MHDNLKILVLTLLIILIFVFILSCKSKEITSALLYMSFDNNDFDKAIQQLKIAAAKDSTNAEPRLLLGVCYGRQELFFKMNEEFKIAETLAANSKNDSLKFAEKIMDYRDDFWLSYFDYGLELFEIKMMANAEIAFWNCTNIDSTRPEAYINLAIIEEENDNFEASLKHYEIAFRNNEQNVDLAFYIASLYTKANKYDKLLEIMNKLLMIEPNNTEALAQKAIAYDYLGETQMAISAYEKALNYIPRDTDLQFNLGRLLFLDEQYEKVVDVLGKVWEQDSSDVQISFLLGSSYLSLGEIELQQVSGKDTLAAGDSVFVDSLSIEHTTDLFNNAIYFLRKTAESDPGNSDVWNYLGVAYTYIGAKREAEEAFAREKALEKK